MGRAVVLGGSIAGLLAASVLADHAEEVVIVERDALLDSPDARPGVPQATQVHVLLPAGCTQLDRWHEGLAAELVAGGACVATAGNARVFYNGRAKTAIPGPPLVLCTRPYLEARLRRRTLALPSVRAVQERAVGIDVAGGRVVAVRYAAAAAEPSLAADFVVDAMGRASRLDHWLKSSGWPSPSMRRVQIDVNYTSALFPRRDPDPPIASVLVAWPLSVAPQGRVQALVTAVEGNRWMVLVVGFAAAKPGRTLAELRAICDLLPEPFAEAVAGEPCAPIAAYAQQDSRRRDFHTLSRLPARLVSLGDAVASFNPVYGQGISSAALHASCLSEYLCEKPDLDLPAWSFFDRQRVVVDAAWQTSAVPDLGLPHVERRLSPALRMREAFANLVLEATVTDPAVARRFNEVVFMRAHPSTLATPEVAGRTLAAAARHARRFGHVEW